MRTEKFVLGSPVLAFNGLGVTKSEYESYSCSWSCLIPTYQVPFLSCITSEFTKTV